MPNISQSKHYVNERALDLALKRERLKFYRRVNQEYEDWKHDLLLDDIDRRR